MDNPFESPVVLSFCPGILGIERGLARTGVHCRVSAYVEIEAFICANLVAGMESGLVDPAPVWTNAKTFDASPFRGRVHGIIGGYPCPGESTAGLREGHLYKGFIWPAIRKAIAAARPLWCFFENVDDHLTGTYPIVQRSLHNMGYRVEAGIYTAEEVGARHERARLFILAISTCQLQQWRRVAWGRGDEFTNGGEKLANCNSNGHGARAGNIVETSGTFKAEEYRQERNEILWEWLWDVIGDSSKKLADTESIGIQGHRSEGKQIADIQDGRTISGCNSGGICWPAGQGYYQHDWEEPRTIESGMGCTIDGYNFREDLLRALGNSVVEQTAELAFIDLLRKHFK